MKIGIALVVIGTLVAIWFFVIPVTLAIGKLPQILTGELPISQLFDWGYFGISTAIALFLGGGPLVVGKDRIGKARNKDNERKAQPV